MFRSALLTLILLAMPGCGSGLEEYPTAKASGKVLCDGQPVANVRLVFSPIGKKGKIESGKSGLADAKEDGTFTVSTYGTEDGAVIGKHNVVVTSPHPEDFPHFTCSCETDGRKTVQEVEVTADGENNFTINLPPRTNASAPTMDPEDRQDIENAESGNG